jgi:uncharacterized protein
MDIFHFTHSDLDGAGCSIVVRRAFKESVKSTTFCNYDTIDEVLLNFVANPAVVNENTLLIITDICPQQDTCKKLNKLSEKTNIILIDHHKTKRWLSDFSWAKFSEEWSATYLTEKYFITDGNKTSDLTLSIDAWDMWKTESDHRKRSEELNTLCKFLGLQEFVDVFLTNPSSDLEEPYFTILKLLEKNKEKYIKKTISSQLLTSKLNMDCEGNTFKLIYADDYISEVGNTILTSEEGSDLKFIAIISLSSNTCSLRSTGSFDVSRIAQRCGGGGHRNAAGFPIKMKEKIESKVVSMLNRPTE